MGLIGPLQPLEGLVLFTQARVDERYFPRPEPLLRELHQPVNSFLGFGLLARTGVGIAEMTEPDHGLELLKLHEGFFVHAFFAVDPPKMRSNGPWIYLLCLLKLGDSFVIVRLVSFVSEVISLLLTPAQDPRLVQQSPLVRFFLIKLFPL